MSDEKTPVLRVAVGQDPNLTGMGVPHAPDYQFIQLGFQAVHNGAESGRQGRPVFDKALMLTHIYPGSTDTLDVEVKRYPSSGGEPIVTDPVRATRFADIIAKFEERRATMEEGTPLSVLNFDPAQIKNLEASGASTVEMLAGVADSNLAKLGMGARNLRQRAIAYLDALNGGEAMAKLQSQLDGRDAEVSELRLQVRELLNDRKPVPLGLSDKPGGDGHGEQLSQKLSMLPDDAKREMAAKGASAMVSDEEKGNFSGEDPGHVAASRDVRSKGKPPAKGA